MKNKQVIVFGATGRVGSLVVQELLDRGFKVRAFVRGQNNLSTHQNLEIFNGDIYDKSSVERSLQDIEIVVSCLGSWGTKRKDVLSTGMRNIVPLMEKIGIYRIVSLTGHDARAAGDKNTLLHNISHLMLSKLAGKILLDGEEHIKLLEKSKLNWTIIRSPIMTNKNDQNYVVSESRPFSFALIPRIAVVKSIIDCVENDKFIKKAIFIKTK